MINILMISAIAIIGTGVDCTMLNCIDGYNNTSYGNRHDTITAQIAQQTCPTCKILPVKVYDKGIVPLDELERGLLWVKKWKKKHKRVSLVINLSMQIRTKLPKSLKRILRSFHKLNVPIVVAAGNGGSNTLSYGRNILVGALDTSGNVEQWSNTGDVYVFAQQFDNQAFRYGTSYATPTVSAILAKVRK